MNFNKISHKLKNQNISDRKEKRESIFLKIFLGVISIVFFSVGTFAYNIYRGYESILTNQVKPFFPPEAIQEIEVNIYNTWLMAVVIFLCVLVMALIFTIAFTATILKQLQNLLDAVFEAKRGNLTIQAKIESGDEIGMLSKEFNIMIDKLGQAQEALEEEKKTLGIRVKARTQELENLARSLDKKVKERTKELQQRVVELERFHRLTVGRELKMIELKEEVGKLKKELAEYKHIGEEKNG